MNHIHWYPGHIAQAQRLLKEKINLVDVVIEIVDARIPYSSKYKQIDKLGVSNKPKIILLNKADLADEKYNNFWKNIYEKELNTKVVVTSAKTNNYSKNIIKYVVELSSEVMKKRLEKGLLVRPVRTMVVGMPNVGKSSTINKLVGRAKTKTGAKAGVTRQQQWVRINEKIELLDTPGIIPTTQDDQEQALKLAMVNSVGENAYDSEYVADNLLKLLNELYPKQLRIYFGFNSEEEITLTTVAIKKNWIIKGSKPDITRTAQIILSSFREGKIGRFTLEQAEKPLSL